MTSQASPELAAAGPPRRLRRWLWITLASSLLIALVAVPLWRYCWHQEYRRLLLSFSPSSRDSYHDPAPWSFAARLPPSWRTAFLRLRTVDIGANNRRPLSAADLRRLHSAVKYRQFGLGIQRLCLAGTEPGLLDGLGQFTDLLYLRLRDCELTEHLGAQLHCLPALNVLELSFGSHTRRLKTMPARVRSVATQSGERFVFGRNAYFVVEPPSPEQMSAIRSLWQAIQLEQIVIRSPGVLDLRGIDLRSLKELHTLELAIGLDLAGLDNLAGLPSLRMLNLRGVGPIDLDSPGSESFEFRRWLQRFQSQRPDIAVVPPGYVSEMNHVMETLKQHRLDLDTLQQQKNAPSSPKE